MNYHNPEQLKDWGQSDGWRLLTTEEKILPDDAEFMSGGEWVDSRQRGVERDKCITYRTRKPLPGSPLIAQLDADIKAKQELREIALAVEAGAEWEVKSDDSVGPFLDWVEPRHPLEWYYSHERGYNWQVRLKPKPVTRPWNKPSDLPPRPCYLRRKDGQSDDGWAMVLAANIHGVVIATGLLHDLTAATLQRIPWESLEDVLHSTDRINWKPCETTEEAK